MFVNEFSILGIYFSGMIWLTSTSPSLSIDSTDELLSDSDWEDLSTSMSWNYSATSSWWFYVLKDDPIYVVAPALLFWMTL